MELSEDAFTQNYQIGDQFVCSAVVDLSLLASGFPEICGWYDLKDSFQKSRGQVKMKVKFSDCDDSNNLNSSLNSNSSSTSSAPSRDSDSVKKNESQSDSLMRSSKDDGNNVSRPREMFNPPSGSGKGSESGTGRSGTTNDKTTHFAINKDATPSDQDQLLLPNEGDEAMDLAKTLNSPTTTTSHLESTASTLLPDSPHLDSIFSPEGGEFNQVSVAVLDLDESAELEPRTDTIAKAFQNVNDLEISMLSEGSSIDTRRNRSSSSGSVDEMSGNNKLSNTNLVTTASPFEPPPQPEMADPNEESLYSIYDDSQNRLVVNLLDNSVMSTSMVSMFDSYLTLDRWRTFDESTCNVIEPS